MPKKYSKDEVRRFLEARRIGVLSTLSPSGEAVLTPIWYLYRNGKILMRTGRLSAKVRHIGRDPRVTFCVQEERPPYASVTIYGRATVEPEDPSLGPAMAKRYLGAMGGSMYMRSAREAIEADGGEVTIALTPERTTSQDFSPEVPLIGRVWMTLKRVLPPQL